MFCNLSFFCVFLNIIYLFLVLLSKILPEKSALYSNKNFKLTKKIKSSKKNLFKEINLKKKNK